MNVCRDPELAVPGPQTRPGATEAARPRGRWDLPCALSFLGSGVGLGVPLKSYCLNVLIAEIIYKEHCYCDEQATPFLF